MRHAALAIGMALVACGGGGGRNGHDAALGGNTDASGADDAPLGALHDAGPDAPPDAFVCIPSGDAGVNAVYGCTHILLLGSPGEDASSDFQMWMQNNGASVTRLDDPTVTVDATTLTGYNILILDHLARTYTSDEATALQTWVAAGGGVMAMSGYTGGQDDLADPNSLLAGMGAQFTGSLLDGPVTTFATHPTTTDLTSVTFSGGFPVTITSAASPIKSSTYTGMIDTTDVALAVEYGQGRAYLWGDEWVTFDSEWSGSPQIETFWIDVFSWLVRYT